MTACPKCGLPPALDGECLCEHACVRCGLALGEFVDPDPQVLPGIGTVCRGCTTPSDDHVDARQWIEEIA